MIATMVLANVLTMTAGTWVEDFKARLTNDPRAAQKPVAAPEETAPVVQATPVPPPIEINSGKALLDSGKPYQTFVQLAPPENCPSSIRTKIIYFPTAKGAVLVRENCKDLTSRTLPLGAVKIVAHDESALFYKQFLLNRSDRTGDPLVVLCSGGTDSGGRSVSFEIRRETATGNLRTRIIRKGQGPQETLEFPATTVFKDKLSVYLTGEPGKPPYLQISLGNFNGLTGFATYELKFPGSVQLSHKESHLTFPTCSVP